jgi:hypothetical protein
VDSDLGELWLLERHNSPRSTQPRPWRRRRPWGDPALVPTRPQDDPDLDTNQTSRRPRPRGDPDLETNQTSRRPRPRGEPGLMTNQALGRTRPWGEPGLGAGGGLAGGSRRATAAAGWPSQPAGDTALLSGSGPLHSWTVPGHCVAVRVRPVIGRRTALADQDRSSSADPSAREADSSPTEGSAASTPATAASE